MVEEGNIGTALAEGTNASGYRGSPITNAIQFSIQNELRKQAKEAEQEAKKQKLLDDALKFKTYKTPIVHPALHGEVKKFGEDITNELIGNIGDPLNTSLANQKAESAYAYYTGINDQFQKDMQNANNANLIVPPNVRAALNAKSQQEYEEAINASDPITQAIYGNSWITRETQLPKSIVKTPQLAMPLVKQDVNKWAESAADELVSESNPVLGEKDSNGKIIIKQAPSPTAFERKAREIVSTPSGVASVLSENPIASHEAIAEIARKNPNKPLDDIAKEVAKKFAEERLITLQTSKYNVQGTPSNSNFQSFDGGYLIGNSVFNSGYSTADQVKPILEKAGLISPNSQAEFNPSSRFPTISPKIASKANIIDNKGNAVTLDNISFIYIPKKDSWYAIGTDEYSEQLPIKIDGSTIGSLAAIYPKLSSKQLISMFSEEQKKSGYPSRVNISLAVKSPNKPIAQTQKGGKTNVGSIFGK